MRNSDGRSVRLAEYQPTPYRAPRVALTFHLDPARTLVRNVTTYEPMRADAGPLELVGDGLSLVSVALDGEPLEEAQYASSSEGFTLHLPPDRPFSLEFVTAISPADNTELMGLYLSEGIYCTQCEAEGFRRITYAYDRPDVLSVYDVEILCDPAAEATLLSNGNLTQSGERDGRAYAHWHDPFPKPSYLFALVAGRLDVLQDAFVTMSGREVALAIYVEPGKANAARYAMEALKLAMRWDEEAFGREYDLDVFNIVAVSTFNMGAMENKGLNVFNDRYVLAEPTSATDADYAGIETVIAHEYFHNWTGNRITCRDWFQLCLKEGLTVYRDQEFTAAVRSAGVKRVEDVRRLRLTQFPEDASPLAHAVRPNEYGEISNLYTPTVYEKGAEIVRMIATLVGEANFRAGLDAYFERFDGCATTVEAFLSSFPGLDEEGILRWYEEPGTPTVRIDERFAAGEYVLTFEQQPAKGASHKPIPVICRLFGEAGAVDLWDAEVSGAKVDADTITLGSEKATVRLTGLTQPPYASWLRGFSAPVKLEFAGDPDRDLITMRRDDDPFTIWNATQSVLLSWLTEAYAGQTPDLEEICEALADLVMNEAHDPAFRAALLQVPTRVAIYEALSTDIDPDRVEVAHATLRIKLCVPLRSALRKVHGLTRPDPDDVSFQAASVRALRNAALHLITHGEDRHLAVEQASDPSNMTDRLAALAALTAAGAPETDVALAAFHDQIEANPLVIDKYFALQAGRTDGQPLSRTQELMSHPRFSMTNPNRVRSVLGAFSQNKAAFHRVDGSGYRMIGQAITELDTKNPQLAARLMNSFADHARFTENRRVAAREVLREIAEGAKSSDVRDLVRRLMPDD